MGLFKGQFANVVEWEEYRDDIIFWKWTNREIKKGSKLIIRAGQDAIFMYNGKIEGIFKDEGSCVPRRSFFCICRMRQISSDGNRSENSQSCLHGLGIFYGYSHRYSRKEP